MAHQDDLRSPPLAHNLELEFAPGDRYAKPPDFSGRSLRPDPGVLSKCNGESQESVEEPRDLVTDSDLLPGLP